METKILSIYLPQFHSIPENNAWWGEGFTEWTNVKRGRSFYPGHYQPRVPLNEDYYDLSDLKVMERHTRLAKKAGIYGFCFHHYYFNGKKLLEKPIENYRDHSKEKFPYCLIWANESWQRRWYGAATDKTMLMQQQYGGEEDWEKQFYYLLNFFKDDRYIKIDNKPVYIIYIPQHIPRRKRMFALWDGMAKAQGFGGIFFIAMNTAYGRDSKQDIYDAYMEFEPQSLFWTDTTWRGRLLKWKERHMDLVRPDQICLWNKVFMKNHFSYSYLCRVIEEKAKLPALKTYPGVFAGWDNTSRKDEAGIVVGGSTPEKFEEHLTTMLRLANRNNKEFLFLNAWNEWSEGAYIEPDERYGYAYLRAVKNAIMKKGNL